MLGCRNSKRYPRRSPTFLWYSHLNFPVVIRVSPLSQYSNPVLCLLNPWYMEHQVFREQSQLLVRWNHCYIPWWKHFPPVILFETKTPKPGESNCRHASKKKKCCQWITRVNSNKSYPHFHPLIPRPLSPDYGLDIHLEHVFYPGRCCLSLARHWYLAATITESSKGYTTEYHLTIKRMKSSHLQQRG